MEHRAGAQATAQALGQAAREVVVCEVCSWTEKGIGSDTSSETRDGSLYGSNAVPPSVLCVYSRWFRSKCGLAVHRYRTGSWHLDIEPLEICSPNGVVKPLCSSDSTGQVCVCEREECAFMHVCMSVCVSACTVKTFGLLHPVFGFLSCDLIEMIK